MLPVFVIVKVKDEYGVVPVLPSFRVTSLIANVGGAGVGVAVGVFVGVAVGVFVGVAVGVFVGVAVGVFVGVLVGVLVGVGAGTVKVAPVTASVPKLPTALIVFV